VGTRVDGELKALLECGVATVIATRDARLAPEIARGWGTRVLPDGTVELCIGLPSGERTVANQKDNGVLGVTCVRPTNYRQVQLKGRALTTSDAGPEDLARVARHREAFSQEVEHVGIAREIVTGFWTCDDPHAMVKVRFAVDESYEQTPGPDAGRPL
jgi:hypothetical protein